MPTPPDRGRGLVRRKRGSSDQGPALSQSGTLLHAATDLGRELVGGLTQIHQLQLDLDHEVDDGGIQIGVLLENQRDVVADGQRLEQRPRLEEDPELLSRFSSSSASDMSASTLPKSLTRPSSGWSDPTMWRSKVDLPQPEPPMMTMVSPGRIFRLMPSRTVWPRTS